MPDAALQRQLAFAAAPIHGATSKEKRALWGLALDDRGWLELLADEWWPLSRGLPGVRLGVGTPRGEAQANGKTGVTAWIDPTKLPSIAVPRWQGHAWVHALRSDVLDEEIAWPGPVPLFAIASFSVAHESDRARFLAIAEGFSNISRPEQPVEVEHIELRPPVMEAPPDVPALAAPENWNAMRGAAAMAVWSVPAIGPWLDVLCASLARCESGSVALAQGAPWWHEPPWRPSGVNETALGDRQLPLWRAAVEVLQRVRLREAWRPTAVLEAIRERVSARPGLDQGQFDHFMEETSALLNDERGVNLDRGGQDPVGLALQLVLLRPSPDRFATWTQELRALPPVVWWTGATLSGLLQGYRDLPERFRGTHEGRRRLALRTWQLLQPDAESVAQWPGITDAAPTWRREGGRAVLLWDGERWGDRSENGRGRWFWTDLSDPENREAAMNLARDLRPACLRRRVHLEEARMPFSGTGRVRVDAADHLHVEGRILLDLPVETQITTVLDEGAFRAWLVRDGIGERLPEPPHQRREPSGEPRLLELRQTVVTNGSAPFPQDVAELEPRPTGAANGSARFHQGTSEQEGPAPPGFAMVLDFVSEAEENELIATIDAAPWRSDLIRRVQHYGWAYDYKARKVDPRAYLGPLPEWAERLGERLLTRGHVRELPDQVIVNEYVGNQGITKHIDCLRCFRGAIVTISLGESWEMFFWPPAGEPKIVRMLVHRSAVVLTGEAREKWKHEIPRRMNEPWGPRGRRVSLTFRTVDARRG